MFNINGRIQITGIAIPAAVIRRANQELNNLKAPNLAPLEKLGATIRAQIPDIRALGKEYERVSNNFSKVSQAQRKVASGQQAVNRSVADGLSNIEDFADKAGLALRRFTAFSIAAGTVFGSLRAIGNATGEAIKFEREMIKVAQVTGASQTNLDKLRKTIGSLSGQFGTSSQELVNAAQVLAQAGKSAQEVDTILKGIAKTTLLPTFDDIGETTQGLIAIFNQFNIKASETDAVIDQLNEVSAKFAIESEDMIRAVQRSGGVFAQASKGISQPIEQLAEFNAILTSVRATTRESAEQIGTSFKTIFGRLQRPDTIKYFEELGIKLTDTEGRFIGVYKAIDQISDGIRGLPERSVKLAEIVEELGGVRQLGRTIPLLTQSALRYEALRVAQQSVGSAAEDAAIAQDNLSVKLDKTNERFLELIRNLTNTGTFQALADTALTLANSLITVADALKEVIPLLAVVGAVKLGAALVPGGGAKQFFSRVLTNNNPIRKSTGSSGGPVPGFGTGDKIPAMLEPGEFVMRKKAVRKIGLGNLYNLNSSGEMMFAQKGGLVQYMNTGGQPGRRSFNDSDLLAAVQQMLGGTTLGQTRGGGLIEQRLPSGQTIKIQLDAKNLQSYASNPRNEVRGITKFNNGGQALIGLKTEGRALEDIMKTLSHEMFHVARNFGYLNEVEFRKIAQTLNIDPSLSSKAQEEQIARIFSSGKLDFDKLQKATGIDLGDIPNRQPTRTAEEAARFAKQNAVDPLASTSSVLPPVVYGGGAAQNNPLIRPVSTAGVVNLPAVPGNAYYNQGAILSELEGSSTSSTFSGTLPQNPNRRRRTRAFNRLGTRARLAAPGLKLGVGAAGAIGAGILSQSDSEFAQVGTGAIGGAFVGQAAGGLAASLGAGSAAGPVGLAVGAIVGAGASLNKAFIEMAAKVKAVEFERLAAKTDEAINTIGNISSIKPEDQADKRNMAVFEGLASIREFQTNQENSDGGWFGGVVRNTNALKTFGADAAGIRGLETEQNVISTEGTLSEKLGLFARSTGATLLQGAALGSGGLISANTSEGVTRDFGLEAARGDIAERGFNKQARERAEAAKPFADTAKNEISRLVNEGKESEITKELLSASQQDRFDVQRGAKRADGSSFVAEFFGGEFKNAVIKDRDARIKLVEASNNYYNSLQKLGDATQRQEALIGVFNQELERNTDSANTIVNRAGGNFNVSTQSRINPLDNVRALNAGDINEVIGTLNDGTGRLGGNQLNDDIVRANVPLRNIGNVVSSKLNAGQLTQEGGDDALRNAIRSELKGDGIRSDSGALGGLPEELKSSIRDGLSSISREDAQKFAETGDLSGLLGTLVPSVELVTEAYRKQLDAQNKLRASLLNLSNQRAGLLGQRSSLVGQGIAARESESRFFADIQNRPFSAEEGIGAAQDQIRAQTGGTSDPTLIAGNIRALQQRQSQLQSGPINPETVRELSSVTAALQSNSAALETLKSGVLGLADIQSELARIEQARQSGRNAALDDLLATPEQRRTNARADRAAQIFQEQGSAGLNASGFGVDEAKVGIERQRSVLTDVEREDFDNRLFGGRIRQEFSGTAAGATLEARGVFGEQAGTKRGKELQGLASGEFGRQQDAITEQRKLLEDALKAFDKDGVAKLFVDGIARLQEASKNLNIPENIKMEVIHQPIQVNISGGSLPLAELGQSIEANMRKVIEQAIRAGKEGQN